MVNIIKLIEPKQAPKKTEVAWEKARSQVLHMILRDDFQAYKALIKLYEDKAREDYPEIYKKMISKLINKPLLNDGTTALHIVAKKFSMKNRLIFINFLSSKGADFNITDSIGHNAYYYIEEYYGFSSIIKH